jgi:RHH-type proline utilization regulon transcriptional repressor/proline dehydrogenase/delta 1-pyrroline-5-carboxylate dehydrogenase
VGEHRDLLAYLVRRLLENGANSSFVHQLADENVGVDELLASPLAPPTPMALPLPVALFGDGRRNSMGVDLACGDARAAAGRRGHGAPRRWPMATWTTWRWRWQLQAGFAGLAGPPLAERAAC